MSRRQFDSTENSELRAKIDEAKRRLPLPQLLVKLGLEKHAKKNTRCPFPDHEDRRPSFSVFKGKDGFSFWKCHSRCGEGDEIAFLQRLKGLSMPEAISLYLEMAGFPPRRASESREYPKSLGSPQYPVSPVSPVSEGQVVDAEIDNGLRALAALHACTQLNTARTRRFKFLRDLKAVEKEIRRKWQIVELAIAV